MKKLLLTTLIAGFALNSQAANLTFATEATYPPFESVASNGQIVGFDVDIMNALCEQMQDQCTLVNAPFDSLIPSLEVGKYDAVIAALGITPAREQVVNFTNSYYQDTVSVVAKAGSGLTLSAQSLAGKTIGVQGDTTFYQYLKATYGSAIKINSYASEESAFLDLQAGRVDAVMGDTPLINSWLNQDNHSTEYALVGQPIVNEQFFGPGNGIAVNKNNPELVSQLNAALVSIQQNGQYQQIVNKWFGQ